MKFKTTRMAEQRKVLPLLVRLAEECGIPLVATNDVHYIDKSDAQAQKVLMCGADGQDGGRRERALL